MTELTSDTKIVIGIISAIAAVVAGLVGNVLAINIVYFFTKKGRKPTSRSLAIWVLFFTSAAVSVFMGSIAAFAPEDQVDKITPKIVVTNSGFNLQYADPKNLLMICRNTIEIANTSEVATSVVAIGIELHIDDIAIQFEPTKDALSWSNDDAVVVVSVWKEGPPGEKFIEIKSLSEFAFLTSDYLPERIDAHSTASVDIDFAIKFTSEFPQKIWALHTLRFPDIEDVKTDAIRCY